jgi:AmmeMemoRadiSam system protein A
VTIGEKDLPPESSARLLELARRSIESHYEDKGLPIPPTPDPALEARAGAFVTLKLRGALRGCIGRVESEWPLWETVARMARAAAFDDPRFPALSRGELEDVTIEVSVMTPTRPVASPADVVPGTHGVMIRQGQRRGVFLPQVASEQGWDRETLLEQLSLKAGLSIDAWREPGVTIEVFRAIVIGE